MLPTNSAVISKQQHIITITIQLSQTQAKSARCVNSSTFMWIFCPTSCYFTHLKNWPPWKFGDSELGNPSIFRCKKCSFFLGRESDQNSLVAYPPGNYITNPWDPFPNGKHPKNPCDSKVYHFWRGEYVKLCDQFPRRVIWWMFPKIVGFPSIIH